jgi:tetratricopeptide (TPR) repeat protein
MSIRSLVLLAALLHLSPAMAELNPVSEQGQALLKQGKALEVEGKGNEAMQRYREAVQSDPKASIPHSLIADLFYRSSLRAPAKDAAGQRRQAEAEANIALKLDERDPMAMEVLRKLADATPQKRHEASDAAQKAIDEGELLFHDKKFADAAEKYRRAIELDPAYAQSYLFLGDCFFMQGDAAQAETWFIKATQVDPLYSIAWRFLFDAQMKQEKLKDAEASMLGAIAAMPSERQSWMRLNQLMGRWGGQLTPFRLVPRARFKEKNNIEIDGDAPESDKLAWMAHGLALAAASEKLKSASPFARDFDAWETTLKIVQETGKGEQIKDEGLRAMQRFHKAGELKAAMFLLLYREAYRADFEAWKKANPGAIKHFIDTFQVGI